MINSIVPPRSKSRNMPPTLSILKWKKTSMSGEFYDTENASTQAYLRKLHLKSDKSYRCFKIFMGKS
jgi:hypothetical protein